MNKKEIFGILLLICVIFSLQAVVAADSGSNSTDSNVLSVDNNVSSYALPSANSNSLEAANEKTFDDLQTVVNNGGTGFANNNYTWNSGNSEVTILKSDNKRAYRVAKQIGEDFEVKAIKYKNKSSQLVPQVYMNFFEAINFAVTCHKKDMSNTYCVISPKNTVMFKVE